MESFLVLSFYDDKKKPHFFVGKAIARFLFDKDGPAQWLSIEAFKPANTSTSTVLEEVPPHLGQDIAKYAICDIICGPLDVTFLRAGKWSAPDYPNAFKAFQVLKALDRKAEYEKQFPMVNDN